jgi:glycosyltransferase involved in cell wall biosynthesis
MIHACHVVAGLKGGPEIIVAQLVHMQKLAGHRVSVVYSPLRDKVEDFGPLFPAGVDFIPWPVGREISVRQDLAAYRTLKSILKDMRPSLVHLHNSKAGAHGRIAARSLGIPVIYSPHGLAYLRSDVGKLGRKIFFLMEWILAVLGGRIVASSEGELEAMSAMPSSIALINNGLDVTAVAELAESGQPYLPPPDRFRIVVVGRIEEQKNPALVARLAAQSPADWEWIWIGEGAQRAVLESSGRIAVAGWQPRETVLATVRSADVFLQASLWEGMSFGLLEAMSLGRPCVVSNVPGNRDVIRSGKSGFVCDQPDDYMRILSRLAANSGERQKLGAGALNAIATKFSLDAIAKQWDDLYRQLLRMPERSSGAFDKNVLVDGTG